MSKPRYSWWVHVKEMTKRYPGLAKEFGALHTSSITVSYSGMPGGSELSRTTENVAVRELPTNKQREYEAVRRTVEATEKYHNGMNKTKIIRLMYWDGTHTLAGAALSIPVDYNTAKLWHRDFLRMVGAYYGYLD